MPSIGLLRQGEEMAPEKEKGRVTSPAFSQHAAENAVPNKCHHLGFPLRWDAQAFISHSP
jgi:hypothetical protein